MSGADHLDDRAGADDPAALLPVLRLLAELCTVPSASVSMVEGSRRHVVAALGPDSADCASEDSVCAAVLRGSDSSVAAVRGDHGLHLVQALAAPDGEVLGALCLVDERVRELAEHQQSAVRVIAGCVADRLRLRQQSALLRGARAEVAAAGTEPPERLESSTADAGHDLRNSLTGIAMSLEMLAEQPVVATDEDVAWVVDRALSGTRRLEMQISRLLASQKSRDDA